MARSDCFLGEFQIHRKMLNKHQPRFIRVLQRREVLVVENVHGPKRWGRLRSRRRPIFTGLGTSRPCPPNLRPHPPNPHPHPPSPTRPIARPHFQRLWEFYFFLRRRGVLFFPRVRTGSTKSKTCFQQVWCFPGDLREESGHVRIVLVLRDGREY